MNKLRVAIDIETECAQGCEEKCEHALDFNRGRISVVGIYFVRDGLPVARTFRCLDALRAYLDSLGDYALCAHNGKFDFKFLAANGLSLTDKWEDDTMLMAATCTDKITPEWLEWYERERKRKNESLQRGVSHRQGSLHSLKCLAPYFLGVDCFWETPDNHDNDEYVLTDCRYTYELAELFEAKLKEQGSWEFYRQKFLPWAKLLLKMETRGIALDMEKLEQLDIAARAAAGVAKAKLDVLWMGAHTKYYELQKENLRAEYGEMLKAALCKLPYDASNARKEKLSERYKALFERACGKIDEQINLDSPAQLTWLLKEYLELDISNFHGEETTGKPVLKKLAAEREDIAVYLEYRKQQKLTQAFFPSYRAMQMNGVLHCSFNPTGARTGRLSSSGPNLQQVPGTLHKLFRARPGYKLITKDESAIEPRIICVYTADENLYNIISSGQNFHDHTTKVLFEADWDLSTLKKDHPAERTMCKEMGLSFFYGAATGRMQETSQKYGFPWSKAECQRKLDAFKDYYQGVFKFRDEYLNPILMSGETVTNLFGRPFSIPDPSDVHMQGFNTLIQGSASDLVVNSAWRAQKKFDEENLGAHIQLLVHDEIVAEAPDACVKRAEEILEWAMTDYNLTTPLGPVKLAVEGAVSDYWQK